MAITGRSSSVWRGTAPDGSPAALARLALAQAAWLAGQPLSYYHKTGPIGDVMTLLSSRPAQRIGVVDEVIDHEHTHGT